MTQLQVDRSVRPAVAGDAHFIASLQAQGMLRSLEATLEKSIPTQVVQQLQHPQVEETWQATLSNPRADEVAILTAMEGAEPCGFTLGVLGAADTEHEYLRLPGIEIAALEVDTEYTRRGHASRLLAALNDTFKGRVTHINTWILQGDEVRILFFQSAGLAPSGIRRKLAVGEETVVQHLWWALC